MKNKIMLMVITIILIILVFFIGIQLGKTIEEKNIKNEMKNILANGNLRNEGFYLDVIKNSNQKQEEILNTKLIVKNKSREEDINVSTRYYILEREINGKWYQIEPIGIKNKKYLEGDTLGISFNTNVKYNIFKDFSEYTKKGLPKGKYRIIFISQNVKENNSKSYIGKEFEIK